MKISIAMATYNGEQYVYEQLQSFAEQSILPNEVVISDDKSSDNTLEIINQFIEKAPFKIVLIQNEQNLGYTGNFNAALMNTTGDVVFLSDQDDVWYPNKIEHMLNVMNNYPDNLVYMNDALLTDSELNSKDLTKCGQIKSAGLGDETFVMGCCCMIRKELLNFCLPIPNKLKGHDDWIVTIADGLSKKYIEKTVLQFYRRHETNESTFIANRITKVTKKDIWLTAYKNIFSNKQERFDNADIFMEQKNIFFQGLLEIKKNIPQKYVKAFDTFLSSKNKDIEILTLRYSLRKSNIIIRVFKAVYYYYFIYEKKTRFQNMLRDMVS